MAMNKEPYIVRSLRETTDAVHHMTKTRDLLVDRLVKSLSDLTYAVKDILPKEIINPVIEDITDFDQFNQEIREMKVRADIYRLVNDIREGKLRVHATDGSVVSFTF